MYVYFVRACMMCARVLCAHVYYLRARVLCACACILYIVSPVGRCPFLLSAASVSMPVFVSVSVFVNEAKPVSFLCMYFSVTVHVRVSNYVIFSVVFVTSACV